jgi:hypothetical protein
MEDEPLPSGDEGPKIANAEALFQDAPVTRPTTAPTEAGAHSTSGVYEVEDVPVREPTRSPSPPIPTAAAKPKNPAAPKPPTRPPRDPAEAVSEVWSRQAEWGQTILIVAGAAVAIGFLLFLLLSMGQFGLAFLVLVAGGITMAILSYPILITLERPVRITPEQAVRDYYTALSHHLPHYRRMWLLLSDEGRISGSFASLEGFQSYWKQRIEQMQAAARASGVTPLKFQIEDFRSEKSAGKSEVDATFAVVVSVRGRSEEGPIETHRVTTSLVKGPDNMWYLDRGTLP